MMNIRYLQTRFSSIARHDVFLYCFRILILLEILLEIHVTGAVKLIYVSLSNFTLFLLPLEVIIINLLFIAPVHGGYTACLCPENNICECFKTVYISRKFCAYISVFKSYISLYVIYIYNRVICANNVLQLYVVISTVYILHQIHIFPLIQKEH